MKFLFRIVMASGLLAGSVVMAEAQPVVSTTKSTYTPYEHVIVTYSGVPTTGTEIVSVSKADDPDTIHANMNFTNHRPSGKMDFDRFQPGTYEARIYFSSDNVVQARHQFTVASPAGVPRIGRRTTPAPPPLQRSLTNPATSPFLVRHPGPGQGQTDR